MTSKFLSGLDPYSRQIIQNEPYDVYIIDYFSDFREEVQ